MIKDDIAGMGEAQASEQGAGLPEDTAVAERGQISSYDVIFNIFSNDFQADSYKGFT